MPTRVLANAYKSSHFYHAYLPEIIPAYTLSAQPNTQVRQWQDDSLSFIADDTDQQETICMEYTYTHAARTHRQT